MVEAVSTSDTTVIVMDSGVARSMEIALVSYMEENQAAAIPQYVKWNIGSILEVLTSDWMDE